MLTGVTPKAYAAANRTQRARTELANGKSVTEAIYGAGFNSSGRFYESVAQQLGMTPTAFRNGGPKTNIHFAMGKSSLGSILVAATEKGICAIFLGDDPDTLARELHTRFPKAHIRNADASFSQVGCASCEAGREPGSGDRFAARRSRYCLPVESMGCTPSNPGRQDLQLHRGRPPDRPPHRGACGRGGLRRQPSGDRHSLSPRRPH